MECRCVFVHRELLRRLKTASLCNVVYRTDDSISHVYKDKLLYAMFLRLSQYNTRKEM